MKTRLILLCLLVSWLGLQAKETVVDASTFNAEYAAAGDGDVLLLASGNYGGTLALPVGKTITLKAQTDASPVFSGLINGTLEDAGGLIFDGVDINRNDNYLIDGSFGNVKEITFRNLTISNIGRCLLRTGSSGYTIDKMEFENCIITDCGANGYNLIYPKHMVKKVSVKNSTLYNYVNGESFFFPNESYTENVFEFVFENNTVYKWAKSSDRALAKVQNKYNAASTYLFRNNIVTEPGVPGQSPKMVDVSAGIVTAENNLIVNYGGYSGGTQTVNDVTLAELGLSGIDFPDPNNGDFSIVSTSPLASAGVDGNPLGAPRWVKMVGPEAVNLTVTVSPTDAGIASPLSGTFNKGDQVTVTATHNYGYRFKEWQSNGQAVSADNPYTFQIETDLELIALFEAVTTYTLTINKEGEGGNWGRITLTPEPINGIYEAGEIVAVTVVPNDVSNFLYWGDHTSELSRQVQMNEDITLTAIFDWVPFIVGWDFNNPSAVRGNRPGDFFSRTDNKGILKLFNSDGSTTNWGGSTRNFGGITYDCARRYTNYANMSNPRYFQAEFSGKGSDEFTKYKNIHITSWVASDNTCVHKKQKLQYATNASGPYHDLATIELDGSSEWIELSAMLPELTEAEKANIYVRWVGDTESGLLGSPSASDTEGFYLANVIVYADIEEDEDKVAPTLLSSVPAESSNTASANGSIVLNFDRKIKAGVDGGKIELDGETLIPTFGSKSVSYPYKNLEYGKEYTFTIPSGVITNKDGVPYTGSSITFTVMERQPKPLRLFDAVVALDSSGDYTTIQDAIDAAPTGRVTPWLIFIKNGSYKGTVVIPQGKSFIHLIGQDRDKTIIHEKINVQGNPENDKNESWYANSLAAWEYSVHNPLSPMYQKEGTLVRVNSSDFYAENITFRNDWGVDAQNGPQALAMMTKGDRASFYNCSFRSFQDTWMTPGDTGYRNYAKDCYIEGAVDYIYGAGDCYFETCLIYNARGGSIIVAPNHKKGTAWGYVFESCIVDGNAAYNDGRTKLGRPWHEFPKTVYLNTTFKIDIDPEGWTDMGGFPEVFAEYNSTDENGDPIDTSRRKTCYSGNDMPGTTICCKAVLDAEEAAVYTYSAVTEGNDNWNPRIHFEAVAKVQDLTFNQFDKLKWETVPYAISYVIYNGENVIGFSTDIEYQLDATDTDASYYVRAVNEYGSLGEISAKAIYKEDQDTSIEKNVLDNKMPVFEISNSELIIRNIEANTHIGIYTTDGRLVTAKKSNSEVFKMSTAGLKGLFIVKLNNDSFKVVF